MTRYIDSSRSRDEDIIHWLKAVLHDDLVRFSVQTGYFDFKVVDLFRPSIENLISDDCRFRFVLGANQSALSSQALLDLLSLFADTDQLLLTVIACANASFHPKCILAERSDGSMAGYVGSGNFTGNGIGLNFESGILLDTREGDHIALLSEIQAAIANWSAMEPNRHAFQIRTLEDVKKLVALGLLDARPARSLVTNKRLRQGVQSILIPRQQLYFNTSRTTLKKPTYKKIKPLSAPPDVAYQWRKLLKQSDAQYVPAGTNPTGVLRLSKSGFPIDPKEWFRYVLFGNLHWQLENRNGKMHEIAAATIEVFLGESSLGEMEFQIDHALHRVADQNNIPTVLHWKPLQSELKKKSYINSYVTLRLLKSQKYELVISPKP